MEDLSALEGMKRAELQRLAKKAGIKANMKTDAIIQALRKHYTETDTLPSAAAGMSCSEDNTTGDESAVSTSESAETSSNEQQVEQTNCESAPPTKKVRRGRKGRKRTKASAKTTADEPSTKTPGQKSATPTACCAPPQPDIAAKRTAPKAGGPSGSAAEDVATIRRETRSVTPKSATGVATRAPVVTGPSGRRTTRSVTPKARQGLPVAAGDAPGRRRRRTYEIEQEQAAAQEASEKGTEPDPEMKKAILAELEHKAEEKLSLQSRIPKPKTAASKTSKPVTPGNKDWRRIHQAQFDKMESIADYVARKRKRTDTLSASVKRAKMAANETRLAVQNLTSHRTPEGSAARIAKPVSRVCPSKLPFNSPKPTGIKGPSTKGGSSLPAAVPKAPALKSVTFKVSRLKTPTKAAVLLAGAAGPKPKRKSTPGPRKSISVIDTSAKQPTLDWTSRKSIGERAGDQRKSTGVVTPFKFGQTATTPAKDAAGKQAFDLKASLSKPLTYKPHTGKVKPLEVSTRFQATSNIQKAKASVLKKPALLTRADRRAGAKQNRANKRADNLMARRGISAL